MHLCLFSYALAIALFEFYNSFFEKISDLKISQCELLEKFSSLIELIEKNLDEVRTRILKLRIYKSILVVSSIFHLLISSLFKIYVKLQSRPNYPGEILVPENSVL